MRCAVSRALAPLFSTDAVDTARRPYFAIAASAACATSLPKELFWWTTAMRFRPMVARCWTRRSVSSG